MKNELSTDVVLISDAKTPALKKLTRQAISTLDSRVNIIVVESNVAVTYRGVTVIHPDIPFNYNAYLNIGARAGKRERILFANNDVLFDENWERNIVTAMKKSGVNSASPLCPKIANELRIKTTDEILIGYDLITRFCGWAFMWTRKLYERAGGLDETFNFWCSDNAAVNQLKKLKEKHALIPSSLVMHIGNGHNTIQSLDSNTLFEYTEKQLEKYKMLFQEDLRNATHFRLNF